jgi:hypothetical protein
MRRHRFEPRPSALEAAFGSNPIASPTLVVIGAGLGLDLAVQVSDLLEEAGHGPLKPGEISVFDAGPLDLTQHLGNSRLPRIDLIKQGFERVGGKTPFWGTVSYRPAKDRLEEWPYPYEVLESRFEGSEREMGVPEPIPSSGRLLDRALTGHFDLRFRNHPRVRSVRQAPIAMDHRGHRWSSLDRLSDLIERGVAIVPHARCTGLEVSQGKVATLRGVYRGTSFRCHPELVALAVGVDPALQLLRDVLPDGVHFQPADHMRIDGQGYVGPDLFTPGRSDDELGISVLNFDCGSRLSEVRFHIESKIAPVSNWSLMPSGDNLRADRGDRRVLVQLQAIAEMNDRLPVSSLVRARRGSYQVQPDLSVRDFRLKKEIVDLMAEIADSLMVQGFSLRDRPLTANHHLYGLLRVGRGLGTDLAMEGLENSFVLAPTAFVDRDHDANPMLSSRVLNSFAADAIARKILRVSHRTVPDDPSYARDK